MRWGGDSRRPSGVSQQQADAERVCASGGDPICDVLHLGAGGTPERSTAAGNRAAVICSLMATCQRYGHNPHEYLRDVLGRLPAMTTKDDLRPLLPSRWTPGAAKTAM